MRYESEADERAAADAEGEAYAQAAADAAEAEYYEDVEFGNWMSSLDNDYNRVIDALRDREPNIKNILFNELKKIYFKPIAVPKPVANAMSTASMNDDLPF